nr:Aplysia gonad lectin, AGL=galactose-binding lectin {N-terminal} [Aplysia californica=mollusks, Peptide Partial, 18 aa] [Aplysia californica]
SQPQEVDGVRGVEHNYKY